MPTENQAVAQLRRAAGDTAADPRGYLDWCVEQAESLMQQAAFDRTDRERLTGVLQALDACGHADQLLIVPLDRWTLFAAAEQELAEVWSRYERGRGTASQSG
jgi:hypothetical protein